MEAIKQKLLEQYDAVYREIVCGQLMSIPVYHRGKESTKSAFAGANGNWGLTTRKQRNNGKPGDVAYRSSIEKMIDCGFTSLQAINGFKGNMRDVVGGNCTDLRNVLVYLLHRIDDVNEILYPDNDIPQDCNEGNSIECRVNRFERDKSARDECVRVKGCFCHVCGIDFEKIYGSIGQEFIHVHHLVPLHAIRKAYQVNPTEDLIPLCPNCHAMIHRLIHKNKLTTREDYLEAVRLLKMRFE